MLICTLILENQVWGNEEAQLLNFVSENRKEKILRYHFDIDKKLSLYGELMLRMEIAKKLNFSYEAIQFSIDNYGKPYLSGNNALEFNLSHTKNAILCGFSKLPIGVDVERIAQPCYEIMPNCFHIEEIKVLDRITNGKINEFYSIWTRKEAYAKWNGAGICQDLTKINTLEAKFNQYFTTWNDGNYNYAIYSKEVDKNIQKQLLSVDDIYKFYRL